jgi:type IV pilus assembly protein PilV
MTAPHPGPPRRNGFTLIEVLIALLVMSIGLLGIGKIMMLSARANDSALMRSQATALGYTILDAMRANRQAALSGAYITAFGVDPGAVACTAAAPCSSGQQAQNDLHLWFLSLLAGLPAGQGSVAITTAAVGTDAINQTTATVTVQWTDTVAQQTFGGPAAGNQVSIVLETVL